MRVKVQNQLSSLIRTQVKFENFQMFHIDSLAIQINCYFDVQTYFDGTIKKNEGN